MQQIGVDDYFVLKSFIYTYKQTQVPIPKKETKLKKYEMQKYLNIQKQLQKNKERVRKSRKKVVQEL